MEKNVVARENFSATSTNSGGNETVRREESRRKIMLQNSDGIRMQEAESLALVARGHEPEGEKK